MSLKSDIWIPIYIGDYLADTIGLTKSEHGSYILVIFSYWRNGGPIAEKEFKKITGEDFETIAGFFETKDGFYRHNRIEKEIINARRMQEALSKRGKAGAEARWKKDATSMQQALPERYMSNTQDMPKNAPSPSPSPSPSEAPSESPAQKREKRAFTAPPLAFENWIQEIKHLPGYAHIDIDGELTKMDAWLGLAKNRGRKKTREFILKWLNRIEAPAISGQDAEPGWQEFKFD